MNILIPYSWLREYVETKATPEKIAECLSLCGPSVEKIVQTPSGSVFDIEVTTNRVDMMSVAGIAREAATILPRFRIKAKFLNDPYKISKKYKIKAQDAKLKVKVKIKNKNLCPRFAAIVIDNIQVRLSPKKIRDRLEASGIRNLNNVIDISNYLMRALGQPVHTFDYDKIGKHTLIMRESRKGEKITTLDDKEHTLPGGDIVIEDGNGELIDLCGIMGGKNTAISKDTKRVLLFIQTYNPIKIRKTSMRLAHRTEAAQLFEKSVDPELVMPTLVYGVRLFKKLTGGKPGSKIYDIYPNPYKAVKLETSLQFIEERLGISLHLIEVRTILENLGFNLQQMTNNKQLKIKIPSWRVHDVTIPEDIVEEVARIYGYHNLPSVLPSGKLPDPAEEKLFYWENKTKNLLKHSGLIETYTYSLQSKKQLKNFNLDPQKHLKLKNPLSKEWAYMRTSLLPSILSVIAENSGINKEIKIFELANTYLVQRNELPNEKRKLCIALTGDKFYQVKGICEALFSELGIKKERYDASFPGSPTLWHTHKNTLVYHKKEQLGIIAEIKPEILNNFDISKNVIIASLDFEKIVNLATNRRTYTPIPKYPPIIEHLTFTEKNQVLAANILKTARETHKLIKKAEIIPGSTSKNRISLEIHYQSKKRSLKDKEIAFIRKKVVRNLEKLGLKLRGKV